MPFQPESLTERTLKTFADRLRKSLGKQHPPVAVPLSACQELVAQMLGYTHWHHAQAAVNGAGENKKENSTKTDSGIPLYPHEGPVLFGVDDIDIFLKWAADQGCERVIIKEGGPIRVIRHGQFYQATKQHLHDREIMAILSKIMRREEKDISLEEFNEIGASVGEGEDKKRLRVFAYRYAATTDTTGLEVSITILGDKSEKHQKTPLDNGVYDALRKPQGLSIISGHTGNGRTTTIKNIICRLLKDPGGHRKILTYEDPIEMDFTELTAPDSIINQLDLGKIKQPLHDLINWVGRSDKYSTIVVNEVRGDAIIIKPLILAAQAQPVIAGFFGTSVEGVLRRVASALDPHERDIWTREFLENTNVIWCQKLIESAHGGRVMAHEHLVLNKEIVTYLLNCGIENIGASALTMVKKYGWTMEQDITRLFEAGDITHKTRDQHMGRRAAE